MSASSMIILSLLAGTQAPSDQTVPNPPAPAAQNVPVEPAPPAPATPDTAAAPTPAAPIPAAAPLPAAPALPGVAAPLPDAAAPLPALPSLPASPSPAAQQPPAADGDIVVTARPKPPRYDPLQAVNMQTYAVAQVADKIVVSPAAKAYSHILPSFFRAGVRHFFNNLNEPIVALNFLLQHKVGKAFETVGRFGLNSTIGVAGLVDVAKKHPFNLPLRRNGFANTMGFYGVGPGPFLYVPLVGPSTLRDLFGLWADKLILPVAVGKPFNRAYYAIPSTIVTTLDYRVEFDKQLKVFHDAPNPYAASRASYLKSRQEEIAALHVHKHHKEKAPPPEPKGAPDLHVIQQQ